MDAPRKALADFEWKAEKEGSFKAVIATFNTIDKDGDVTLPGAFAPGMTVAVSPWGHTSGDGALPVGDAVITSDGSRAIAEGQFYTDTPHGKAAYQTVKRLSEKGIQQWSYIYRPKVIGSKKDLEAWPGARRVLKEVQPFEVSPVLVGAGEGVFTQSIKSDKDDDPLEQLRAALESYLNNEEKVGARFGRASRDQISAVIAALQKLLDGDTEEPAAPAPAKADEDPELIRIAEHVKQEHERTALMDLRWI